ncbi:hypothetical protein B9T07_08650 [Limnospira fusiformis CCALA 023]|uniref:hypothetical protein n=1 Tax=Oscillatoriales TaxID=1150 RepID=UPI00396E0168
MSNLFNSASSPAIIEAVEKLGYRVSSADVAIQAGLEVNLAQQQLLALASEAGGHLQVAESGDIAFLFPQNFRAVMRNRYWRLRVYEWWQKVWRILFYLIRISFGIMLLVSIVLIFITIAAILFFGDSNRNGGGGGGGGGGSRGRGLIFIPHFWFHPNSFSFLSWDNGNYYRQQQKITKKQKKEKMNFFEVVFSFLFGDGNPNYNLEAQRWQGIATVIRNNQGAVVAEQIAPYLDNLGNAYSQEFEDYMLPVLTRFNGQPEVSPQGQLVYHFPELQTTATKYRPQPVPAYLKENNWKFSNATSNQLMLAAGLGAVNFVGALILGHLLEDGAIAAQMGGLVAFVEIIYPLLFAYGAGFMIVPLIRYFWVQWRNGKIAVRNEYRQSHAIALNQADDTLKQKLKYARKFAAETVISNQDLAYTTETDMLDQEAANADKIDAEWQKRLNQSDGKST